MPAVASPPATGAIELEGVGRRYVVLGMAAVALAPLFTARRMRGMDVPSTLRVVE